VSAPDSSRGMLRLRCFAFPRSGNLGLPSGSSSAVERQLPKFALFNSHNNLQVLQGTARFPQNQGFRDSVRVRRAGVKRSAAQL